MPRVGVLATMLLLVLVTCAPRTAPVDVVGAQARPDTAVETPLPPAVAALPAPGDEGAADLPTPIPEPATSPLAQVELPPAQPAPPAEPAPPPQPPPAAPAPAPPPEPPPPPPRAVVETGWSPFATVGGVVLHHPSARVERVGFHESNHDGARQLDVLATAVHPITMETRERGTGSRSAADIVVDPHTEIRAPVTGTVRRAGTYVLYCDYRDDFAVIEPDAHPGWEVKLLHINGVRVQPGMRVQAGETVVAGGPTPLPFSSQVDEHTAEPSWPHVHVEVVDPSIPNRPKPGGGC